MQKLLGLTRTVSTARFSIASHLKFSPAKFFSHTTSTMAPMAPISKECEYLVIGGGSGGLASARRACGLYGTKTIVVEGKKLGGTCVNEG